MRLIDIIRRKGHMLNTHSFIADDILGGINEEPVRQWHAEEFPKIAPPFNEFLIEAKHPEISGAFVGMFFQNVDLPHIPAVVKEWARYDDEVKWRYTAMGIEATKHQVDYYPMFVYINIGPHGEWIDDTANLKLAGKKGITDQVYLEELRRRIGSMIVFCMMTLSILNCKNIEVVDNPPEPHLSKASQKKYGIPLAITKTLYIHPIGKTNANPNHGIGDRQPASHLVRGHFRDYTEGEGLFGKYHGMFFFESHARGSTTKGKIEKNYRVFKE